MAIAHAQKLITQAQAGEKHLTASERRLCIQYLQATQPELTNNQMGEWFGVSERTIRLDKNWIREQKARFLKDELSKDLALVIADIAMDFEQQVRDIEKSKQKTKLGTSTYVMHCNSVFDMRLRMVKAFQDIGYLPKNLGSMTVEKFEYKAEVTKDGALNTRPVDMFDNRDAVDAEFTDVPALPERTVDEQDTSTPSTVHAELGSDEGSQEPSPSQPTATASVPSPV